MEGLIRNPHGLKHFKGVFVARLGHQSDRLGCIGLLPIEVLEGR